MALNKIILLGFSIMLLGGCSTAGGEYKKVQAMQRKDKNLSCKEVLLEMNEAEFYKQMAFKNKGPKLKNILMPLGYVSTYMDANEVIESANARVSYLDRIYEIMQCESKRASAASVNEDIPVFREVYIPKISQGRYPNSSNTAMASQYAMPDNRATGYNSPY
ncbi:hypothetical protein N9W34_01055 [Rickettsiales bacterium]|nr:hypothetical protein [Rickettsiales bacterium]